MAKRKPLVKGSLAAKRYMAKLRRLAIAARKSGSKKNPAKGSRRSNLNRHPGGGTIVYSGEPGRVFATYRGQVTGPYVSIQAAFDLLTNEWSKAAGKFVATSTLPSPSMVEVKVWEERDRLHIELRHKFTGKTIAEWWDDDARQMFEDGFFKSGRDLDRSVIEYAQEMGLLANGNPLYVGLKSGKREVFRHPSTPTEKSHGDKYGAVIGPFRTKPAAELMAGPHGPLIQTVSDAERAVRSKPRRNPAGGQQMWDSWVSIAKTRGLEAVKNHLATLPASTLRNFIAWNDHNSCFALFGADSTKECRDCNTVHANLTAKDLVPGIMNQIEGEVPGARRNPLTVTEAHVLVGEAREDMLKPTRTEKEKAHMRGRAWGKLDTVASFGPDDFARRQGAVERAEAAMFFKRNPSSGPADETAARELQLYIENEGDLYRQQHLPIIANLMRKRAAGIYDHELAVKLFMYLVESGAKKYAKEFSTGTDWSTMFNKNTRLVVAASLRDDFEAEADLGSYTQYIPKKYQKNPLTRNETNVILDKGREALDLAERNLAAGFPVAATMNAGMAFADGVVVKTATPRKYASHHAQGAVLRHEAYSIIKPEMDREARRSVGLQPNPAAWWRVRVRYFDPHADPGPKWVEETLALEADSPDAAGRDAVTSVRRYPGVKQAKIVSISSMPGHPPGRGSAFGFNRNPLVMTVMGNPYTLKGGDKQAIRNIVSRLSVGATDAEAADAIVAKLAVHAPAHVITAVRNYAAQCHRANQKLYGRVARGMNPGPCQNPGHRHRNPVDYQDVYSAAQKVGYSIHDASRVASAFKRTGELPRTVEAQLRYFKANPLTDLEAKALMRQTALAKMSPPSSSEERAYQDGQVFGYADSVALYGPKPMKRKAAMLRSGSIRAFHNPGHQAFDVFLDGKHIDTVFYGENIKVDVDEVKRSLVGHDGYDPDIEVKKRRAGSTGPRGPLHPHTCFRCGGSLRGGSVATASGRRVCHDCADDVSTGGQRRNPEGEDVVREWLPVPKDPRKQVYARRVKGTFKEALRHAQERAGRWNTIVLLYEIDLEKYPLEGSFKDVWAIARPHGGYEIVKGRKANPISPAESRTLLTISAGAIRGAQKLPVASHNRLRTELAADGRGMAKAVRLFGPASHQTRAKRVITSATKTIAGYGKRKENPGKVTRRKVTMTLEAFAKMVKAKNDPKLWAAFLRKVEAYKKWSHGTLPKKVTVEQVNVPGMSGMWMTYDAGKAPETAYVMPRGTKRKGAWVHQWDTMPDLKNDPESGIVLTKLKGKSRITDFYHR